jgi:hypothetical protein
MLTLMVLSVAAQAAELGGYFRVQARPDLVGGDGKLGQSALMGRLMNEGAWALLDVRQDLVKPTPGTAAPWGDLHLRVEGGAMPNAEATNGLLSSVRMSQFYLQAGNVAFADVTWRVGTLETTFGDLWLYDARPTQMFVDTLGAQATWKHERSELSLAVGDAGWSAFGLDYRALPTAGGIFRQGLGEHVDVGVGGQAWVDGEDVSVKAAAYVGFGKVGPLSWNRLQLVWKRPFAGPDELFLGDELELDLGNVDVAWAAQYSRAATTAVSTVARGQVEVTPTVALLGETAIARETAAAGAYRTDDDGDARDTWQGKAGVVLSPAGAAMGARPALRFLYGVQHSTERGSWPGADSDLRWHHLVAVEAETWF